jgi:hypothetical protein
LRPERYDEMEAYIITEIGNDGSLGKAVGVENETIIVFENYDKACSVRDADFRGLSIVKVNLAPIMEVIGNALRN